MAEKRVAPPPKAAVSSDGSPFIHVDEKGQAYYWDSVASKWIPQSELVMPEEPEIPVSVIPQRTQRVLDEVTEPVEQQATEKVGQKRQRENHCVFLSGLDERTTEEDLVEFCSKCGIIKQDPYNGDTLVIVDRNDKGQCIGTGLVHYYRPESVELAVQILDESYIRSAKISVQPADEVQQTRFHKKRTKREKKTIVVDQSQILSWEEESRVHVVMKNLYRPEDGWEDLDYFKDLKEEVKEELERCGELESVAVFPFNPEGVVAIKFKANEGAAACIALMDGRFFGGRKITAEYYDGKENFHRDETEEMKAKREAVWERFLEQGSDDE